MEDKKILGPDGKKLETGTAKEVEMPEDIKKKIDEKRQARKDIMNEFVEVSLQRALAVKREQELIDKLKNNADSLNAKIKYAYDKLKLDKESDYAWRYREDGKFIGFPKKKKE